MTKETTYSLLLVGIFIFCQFINVGFGCLFIGLLLIGFGINTILYLKKLHETGIECIGTILSFRHSSELSTPVIKFTTAKGETVADKPYSFTPTDLHNQGSFDEMIEKQVLILYSPEEPRKFMLAEGSSFHYLIYGLLILGGVVFCAMAVCSLLGIITIN